MATMVDVKGSKNFCDTVYSELAGIKRRILDLRENAAQQGNEVMAMYDRHLCELAEEIDWKLQILSHSCSYDWKGSAGFEDSVQVDETGRSKDVEFSPGYLGG